MKIIPPAIRELWIKFCRQTFAEKAIRSPQPQPAFDGPASLHMVVSSHTWKMGVLAMRSFEFHTGMRWRPFIHEDGSLTDAMVEELAALQPDATIVRRKEADARMSEALKAWPICRENRHKHNWFLKYFDTYFLAPHEQYFVVDSDIVFFRKPGLILDWLEQRKDTLHFMEDTRETYNCPREELEAAMGFDFWRSVNSGICLMRKQAVDLDLVERFLSRFAGASRHFQFLEQTLFALTGSAWKKGGTLPKEYEISWGNFRHRDAVCRHYVGPFKDDALYVEGATAFWLQLRGKKS